MARSKRLWLNRVDSAAFTDESVAIVESAAEGTGGFTFS